MKISNIRRGPPKWGHVKIGVMKMFGRQLIWSSVETVKFKQGREFVGLGEGSVGVLDIETLRSCKEGLKELGLVSIENNLLRTHKQMNHRH
jgi:hypothetical protein